MRTGEVARTDDFPNRTGTIADTLRELGYMSTAAAPIVFSGRPWGAIVIATKDGGPLPEHSEQRLSDFAELVGLALASTDARNVSLDNATGDWIMYLDADEHIEGEDAPRLRELLGRTWREGFNLVETNYTGGEDTGSATTHLALRLWRRRPEYRFEGRIHEQKTHTMPMFLPERFETTTIRVRHYGYLNQRIASKEKSQRNIELLEQEARENPSPFNDYNLAMSFESASMRVCCAIIPAAAEYSPFSMSFPVLPWRGSPGAIATSALSRASAQCSPAWGSRSFVLRNRRGLGVL